MFTEEAGMYIKLVSRFLDDGSEDGMALLHSFLERYHTPLALKNMSDEEKATLMAEDERIELLLAAVELGRLVVRSKASLLGKAYSSQTLSGEMMDRLAGEEQEGVYLVGTNIHNEIIDLKKMFIGGASECNVYPDQLFRHVLLKSLHGIAIIHNHPSGNVEPSTADLAMVKRLVKSAQLLGITFLDFMIIGQDNYYSWRENQAFQKDK